MAALALPSAAAASRDAATGQLGATDCERISDGLLAQPVAALTSLGYVVMGAALLWHFRSLAGRERWVTACYAVLLAASGLGSVVYHGPQGPGARLVHDLPVVLIVAQAVLVPATRLWRGRPVLRRQSRRYLLVGAACALVAGLTYVLGRTGSAACDPDSLVQLHGLWHLASAGVLTAWGLALWPAAGVEGGDDPGGGTGGAGGWRDRESSATIEQ